MQLSSEVVFSALFASKELDSVMSSMLQGLLFVDEVLSLRVSQQSIQQIPFECLAILVLHCLSVMIVRIM